jgi:rhodanese-related sulfurtransferase
MKDPQDMIQDAKNAMPNVTPTPPDLHAKSSPQDLKARLEWGEPALTILDVRERETFNKGHIMGAMAMPMDSLVDRAQSSLEKERDIYVYGASDADTQQAATQLREAGFTRVAELQGGFDGWKAISGPTEGTEEIVQPGPDAYNVVARVSQHLNAQKNA